jgi:hypothetical protein
MPSRETTRLLIPLLAVHALAFLGVGLRAAEPKAADPAAIEFFEKEVRPLLAARCQGCHGATKQKGDLRLDSRTAILAGGSTGPAIVPGKPGESLLIDAVNYGDLYKMPPKSKLPAGEIATLTKWVELGAPWPAHDSPATPGTAPRAFNLKERASQWCLQPIRVVTPPAVAHAGWARTPTDAFILAALEAKGLSPAPEADRRTLLRRLTFDLTGLPPTPAEIDAFLADRSADAYDRQVERLLASTAYGERWGRHWLDLVRYAETSGHEFDYELPDAYRYRDYIIRAFNADVPYDQLVIEHVAGDLLDNPRRNPGERFNESILGTGFFLLGEGTHSPVDVRDEGVRRVENQIDVFGKTFLGLTLACARCHDHKFDAIATTDYYALAGYLRSSRHQHAFIDPPERIGAKVDALRALKEQLRPQLPAMKIAAGPAAASDAGATLFEDFDRGSFDGWFVTGDAFGTAPTRADDFVLRATSSPPVARAVRAGQAHSGLVSDRLEGVLRSRTFVIDKPFIHYLASGRKGRINVVVDGFEKIREPIYGRLTFEVNSGDEPRWHVQNVGMWIGHRAYIEIADGATVNYNEAQSRYFDGGGFIAVDEIRFSGQGNPGSVPDTHAEAQINLRSLGNKAVLELVARYAQLEAQIPAPRLALALADGTGEDERVHVRGSYQTLGEVVPRRFLQALAGTSQGSPENGSGRLELARRMVDHRTDPLLPRVLVNRVWKLHFGEGIVKSTDDFGNMGQPPSHPELLDWLADEFVREGWSIKQLHRQLVGSSAYRMSSALRPDAERVDPTNRLLHRMNVRRLEAEALRDAILAVSGRLNRAAFGPSVPVHLTSQMEGRGRPSSSGPLDGDGRRSVYLNVRRNFLNPMLAAFDFPTPFSTIGRRNVSNVPAQALTLLNDPFVIGQASAWAGRLLAERECAPRARLERLYLTAFGRPPTESEAAEALGFLTAQTRAYGTQDDRRAWVDLCHVLLNVKEFIYVN